jgi:nucleoside phosphorylase
VTRLLKSRLSELNAAQPKVLVMGLCGSLVLHLQVKDAVVYSSCVLQRENGRQEYLCDRALTNQIQTTLGGLVKPVQALTSDRVVCSATTKRMLAITHGVDVVDMEGGAILSLLGQQRISVAMLRVVSDDCDQDLPDLSTAVDASGNLQPGKVAIAMVRQPMAATHLIRGSLHGLQKLQSITQTLFAH